MDKPLKESIPDLSLGFVDITKINTLLNLILTGKPLLSNDVYLWLDQKGYKSQRAENTLRMLEYASVVKIKNDYCEVTKDFLKSTENRSQEEALKHFLLNAVPEDDLRAFTRNAYVFNSESLIWKPDSMSPFQVQIRDLLLSMQLLRHDDGLIKATEVLIMHLRERNILDDKREDKNKQITNDELEIALEIKKKLGEQAEKLALEFEKHRISEFGKEPVLISKDNVASGYDIESYETANSDNYNRHIEVKYFNNNHFYISLNEIETAKTLGNSYWIYLVSIKNDEVCHVQMINNPYTNIINSSEWNNECVLFRFERKPE